MERWQTTAESLTAETERLENEITRLESRIQIQQAEPFLEEIRNRWDDLESLMQTCRDLDLCAAEHRRYLDIITAFLQDNPDDATIEHWVASALLRLAAEERDYDTILADAAEITARFPDAPVGWKIRGNTNLARRAYTTATSDFREAVRCAPENLYLLTRRSYAYRRDNRFEEAIADLDTVERLGGVTFELAMMRASHRIDYWHY